MTDTTPNADSIAAMELDYLDLNRNRPKELDSVTKWGKGRFHQRGSKRGNKARVKGKSKKKKMFSKKESYHSI